MEKRLKVPMERECLESLRAGDVCLLSGRLITARDAAHKKMTEAIERGENLPVDIKGAIIYYMGPTPARPGRVTGSAGPTTSGRMDKYTPKLLEMGLYAMIGKGVRSDEVKESIKKNKAVYFAAVGGAGALLSKCIKKSEVKAYEDLGPEAVRELEVEDFPVIVVTDSKGNSLY